MMANDMLTGGGLLLIEVLLEAGKHPANLLRLLDPTSFSLALPV